MSIFRDIRKSHKDFLSLKSHRYDVLVTYRDGTKKRHKNVENPWAYKKKAENNIDVKSVQVIPLT